MQAKASGKGPLCMYYKEKASYNNNIYKERKKEWEREKFGE